MRASPALKVRKAIPAHKVRQVIQAGRLDLKGLKAMMVPKVRPAFKVLLEMTAQPALKGRKASPVQTDQLAPKAHKACRVILGARRVRKALKETTGRPVLRVRPVR